LDEYSIKTKEVFTENWDNDTVVIEHIEKGIYKHTEPSLQSLEVTIKYTPTHPFYQDESAIDVTAINTSKNNIEND
jgi:hypothetical protein